MMALQDFLHDLHFEIDRVRPPDAAVDWVNAPLPYKLYRGLPMYPLSAEVPLTLPQGTRPVSPTLRHIGHFLWYVFGLTQLSQTPAIPGDEPDGITLMRRFAPSGGALYPSELYVYLNLEEVPAGVYHYDVAHHRLMLVRRGEAGSYLARATGLAWAAPTGFGALVITTMFWKNYFKYHDFSARLHGLDAGVLMGQALEVAKRFGWGASVCFEFLDGAVNHWLGLPEGQERAFAVMPLSVDPAHDSLAMDDRPRSAEPRGEHRGDLAALDQQYYERSRGPADCTNVLALHRASELAVLPPARISPVAAPDPAETAFARLPAVTRPSYDLAAVSRRRYSPGTDFVLRKVTAEQLATLFHEASASFAYLNDLGDSDLRAASDLGIHACLHGIAGIPDGAYAYDVAQGVLRVICPGDHRARLQQGMSMHNVNLYQVPVCLHVVGDRAHRMGILGPRGYRIQQMEAGMLVQRLLLAACAVGMNGHPLLGFDAAVCDTLYRLPEAGRTTLIQVPVGFYRIRPRLDGCLHA